MSVKPTPKKQSVSAKQESLIYYFTVGTSFVDENDSPFISEDCVKTDFERNIDLLTQLEDEGVIIILRDEVLAEYLKDGFAYVDNTGSSTAEIRKLREVAKESAEKDRKLAELEAKLAALEKGKGKGGNNG